MKIVVTGAGGFIGTHICKYFINKKCDVIGWDIVDKDEAFDICKIDMLDIAAIEKHLIKDSPDIIIHCAGAAEVGKSIEDPFMDYNRNVTITHNLLFAMHKIGFNMTRMVFLSSAAVYGNPETLPIREDAKLNPLSPYALHKVLCEEICQYMHNNYNMDIKILRIFSAYGEGLKKQIFWDMHTKVKSTGWLNMFGTGKESRDYINIVDLIRAIYMVSIEAPKDELVYNIANGEEITIREAAERFADAAGIEKGKITFSGKEKEGNPINWCADITKLEQLGYQKKVEFCMGILNYVNWARTIAGG